MLSITMGSECCQSLCLVKGLKLLITIYLIIIIIIIIIKEQIKETRDKETEIFEASDNQLQNNCKIFLFTFGE
jgi:Ca2+/Na+ antiporter